MLKHQATLERDQEVGQDQGNPSTGQDQSNRSKKVLDVVGMWQSLTVAGPSVDPTLIERIPYNEAGG